MSVLNTSNLGVTFGDFDLFRGVSVSIANDSRIGLIGPNGVGKTTLLLILAGLRQPSTGEVYMARKRRLGYLRQEAVDAFVNRDNTVYGEMLSVFEDLLVRQQALHKLEAEMAAGNYSEDLLETYGRQQEAFEKSGGYEIELNIQQTLQGLGLGKETWDSPLAHLSGGQKTRALLARLLLEKPDLLMLDEPTNHLDMEAVEWLEKVLKDWEGAVIVVSHDRFFLDNTVNTIWEMGREGIEVYSGNYSSYLLQRDERWDYYERVYKEEKQRLLKQVDFIQRNWVRDSTHARALGLLRRLSRDIAVVENFGIMALRSGKKWSEFDLHVERPLDVIEAIRRVNAISLPSGRPNRIRPQLKTDPSGGAIVLRAPELSVGYHGNPLFEAHDLELRRGECAVLIGPNGSGKTTFLKVLMEELDPLQGEIWRGPGFRVGYFAQAHDNFNPENSVLDELLIHKPMQDGQARSYLATYLFKGEDVFKPVQALSGGEKARLALAILALQDVNFLVLDEPTNHLDIPAQEALQEVLEEFAGTILLVSHDRYLINRLATQVWELRENELQVFKGTYREFILCQNALVKSSSEVRKIILPSQPLFKVDGKEARKRAQALDMLEERIRQQESSIKKLSRELQNAGQKQAHAQMHELSWKMAQAQNTLDELLHDWEKMAV